MNADGTGLQQLTSNDGGTTASGSPAWSPDGSQIAFWSNRSGADEIWIMGADGSDRHPVTSTGCNFKPDWSPVGDRIAFQSCRDGNDEIYLMNRDGTDEIRLTDNSGSDRSPAWSPDGQKIAFSTNRDPPGNGDIYLMKPDGTNQTSLTTDPAFDPTVEDEPAWAPDNGSIVFSRHYAGNWRIWRMSPSGLDQFSFTQGPAPSFTADWGPRLPRGHARPKSASPLHASLVPAHAQCTAPDRTHGPPLAFPSCGAPGQTSPFLTVGTPDANGAPPKSASYVRFRVAPGVPGPPHDTQVLMYINITDVRCAPGAEPCGPANDQGGADYAGELEGEVTVRITDTDNAVDPGGGADPATMTDYVLRLPLSCAATADTTAGSICSRTTSLVAFGVPGIVPEGTRAIWELGSVRFDDGGADGVVSTSGNTPFLTQGVFIP